MPNNDYNPFSWLVSLLHIHHESVFVKLKYFLIFMVLYALTANVIDYKFDINKTSSHLGEFHLLFSFCLSIIIVFRINVAYNRWWEGRGLWGQLVNISRNLAIKMHSFVGVQDSQPFLCVLQNFPTLLKYHLRKELNSAQQLMDKLGISYQADDHLPSLLIHHLQTETNNLRQANKLSFEQFMSLDKLLSELTDVLGGCEKIVNTPVPRGFNIFARFALLFYMLIFPFGWVDQFGIFIVPILIVLIYILLGLEMMAEEMEAPFATAHNCLPLDDLAQRISLNIAQISQFKLKSPPI
ncbi:MAG: hypothetical protein KBD32_02200 [Burkholderiales bacterium]|nr:hypothetical protein [Burkholderiales bacterium]